MFSRFVDGALKKNKYFIAFLCFQCQVLQRSNHEVCRRRNLYYTVGQARRRYCLTRCLEKQQQQNKQKWYSHISEQPVTFTNLHIIELTCYSTFLQKTEKKLSQVPSYILQK